MMRLCLWVVTTTIIPSVFGWHKWSSTGPDGRQGHTIGVVGDLLIIFGGRGDDRNVMHQPNTYELVSRGGKLEFSMYEHNPLPKLSKEVVSLVENDPFIDQCIAEIEKDATAPVQNEYCDYNGTMSADYERDNYIPIADYYNDIWIYNISCERYGDDGCWNETDGWQVLNPGAPFGGCYNEIGKEICTHPSERYDHEMLVIDNRMIIVFGGYSPMCGDYCDDYWMFYIPENLQDKSQLRWVRLDINGESPGKRWRTSSVVVNNHMVYLFGGHRLWHGFSPENSRDNEYSSHSNLPEGGYLNDLWSWDLDSCRLYNMNNDSATLNEILDFMATCNVSWIQVTAKQECTKASMEDGDLIPGHSWGERHYTKCKTTWPVTRSGHRLRYMNNQLYLYGGFRTVFPYPTSASAGSGPGNMGSDITAYTPTTFQYYLDDFWAFNLTSGYWSLVNTSSTAYPGKRTEYSMEPVGDIFILIGGYRTNFYLNDLWFFNVTTGKWLEKAQFVHPLYPSSCIGDQLVEACPTRGTILDGKFGRLNKHLFVNVTRRQSPGWDGCRDRVDNRTDLPQSLMWERPSQRSNHAVAISALHGIMFLFGGFGYEDERFEQATRTFTGDASSELWAYQFTQCTNNCSDQGYCHYGTCLCDPGFYGYDCSNISCPGDSCYFDYDKQEYVCSHCCHAPYSHTDEDVYLAEYSKVSCSREIPGESNGICDGYGHCLCAPPYTGLDCSVKGCLDDCNGRGFCILEYPVGRCQCDPGYSGRNCEIIECLNNCSYPNGNCVNGVCQCQEILDPYNRSRVWRKYEGDDCSFLIPFSGANRAWMPLWTTILMVVVVGLYYK